MRHVARFTSLIFMLWLTVVCVAAEPAAEPAVETSRGDRMIAEYFQQQTELLRDACLTDIETADQWKAKRQTYRRELLEMLGLDPLPLRTDLKATVTGTTEHEEFIVEKVHFQSRPGLYVTGNLYIPKVVEKPLPAILYVCGHGNVKENGVSYGSKVHYQHHGAWFARNGYVCLTIDTLQLGEIEGIHHGTYRYKRWWWLNRGYTPAGVEAWNCVRALDYLQTRKEVDGQRLGVTGRSGGGAYSWWIAAIDERIKVAVPVAGMTDLENHVIDGTVEGHCDCMFMVNTYRWDYAKVAALVAPRPLLISNTDRDRIFPLEGVIRTHAKVRHIYELYGEQDKLALHITAGPHKDTQELRVHAFRWFNYFLKDGEDALIERTAVKFFAPEELRVFQELPSDEINTKIDETFVATASPAAIPKNQAQWTQMKDGWRRALEEKVFRGWPSAECPLDGEEAFSVERHGIRFRAFDFTSQDKIRLRLYVAHRAGLKRPELVVLNVLDSSSWNEYLAAMRTGFEKELASETLPAADERAFKETQSMFKSFDWAMAYVAPRGVGPTRWDQSEKKQTQHRRRFYLLGQSLDGMRVWDVRRSIQMLRTMDSLEGSKLWLQSHRAMAGVTLYASLFEPEIARLDLYELSHSHRDGPYLLNVRRYLDLPQVVAMAAENSRLAIYDAESDAWSYPTAVVRELDWDTKRVQVRKPPFAIEKEKLNRKKSN